MRACYPYLIIFCQLVSYQANIHRYKSVRNVLYTQVTNSYTSMTVKDRITILTLLILVILQDTTAVRNKAEESPAGMFLLSSGLTLQQGYNKEIHGLYRLINVSYNSAPVYKKIGQNLTMYLFLDSDFHWEISPDLGGKQPVYSE